MGSFVDWFGANWEFIRTVLSSGIVLAILGFVTRLLRRAWLDFHGRGRAVLIRSSRSRLVGWIEQIQERIFPADECDPNGVLGKRIDRSKFGWWPPHRPHSPEAVIAIVYLKGRTPVAYLSAEYFRETRGIFFWYIVSLKDKKYKDALSDMPIDWDEIESVRETIAPTLIARLLDVCGGNEAQSWRYVVAEVDNEDIALARKKVGGFQRAAEEVIHRWRDDWRRIFSLNRTEIDPRAPRVFKIDMPFAMPLHDADLLHESAAHESPGWMLFAPRNPDRYKTSDGDFEITGEEVRDSLLTTFDLGYRNGDEAFDAYIAAFYERLGQDVPERVRMIHNRAIMQPQPAAVVEPVPN